MNAQPGPGDNNSESSCDDGKDRTTNEGENDSSSSTNGKGSGSGGGYNGDCSSSDASSSDSSSKHKQAAAELSVSALNMKRHEKRDEHNQQGEEKMINNRTQPKSNERRHDKKNKDSWIPEDQQYSSWDLASATQVAIQISALAAIIEQNRMIADETSRLDGTLPQWNGIRISHPMDPRIDLRTVGHIPGSNVPVASSNMMNVEVNTLSHDTVPPPTVDNYMNLMEAVRPYFHSYGFPMPQPPTEPIPPIHSEKGVSSDGTNGGTGSSEGFTAFFTTTEKSNSSDSSDRKSNVNNKNMDSGKAVKVFSGLSGTQAVALEQEKATANVGEQGSQDESDSSSSSMVVLARVKRKHQRRMEKEGEWNSNGSSVQPGCNDDSPSHQVKAGVKGFISNQQEEKDPSDSQESSSSSASSSSGANPPIPVGQDVRQHFPPPNEGTGEPRIVSETNTASNTSGSGSGGNSGSNSGTNSGSGSNPGSSGSGNENAGSSGSGNEGKGSSDDAVAKDDNSGGDGNAESAAMDVDKVEAHVHDARKIVFAGDEYSQEDEASREHRLLDKKRKRMNMRREYEEQVQQDLDSEDSPEEVDIRPGKPVTLDAVLSFTKIARIVVQATPPFLVVHTNAAFTALTGIDSHSIVGKPIRGVVSVPHSKQGFMLTEIDHTDGSQSGQSSMTNSASGNRQQDQGASAQQDPPGRQLYDGMSAILNHEAAAAAGQARANSNEMQDIDVERLIAASGFGHIHIMNVLAKPHHHHLLGPNVSVTREGNRGGNPHLVARLRGEHGSDGSSIPSNDGPFHFMACRMGVSPVVSVTNLLDVPPSQVAMDHENANKRRKYPSHRRHSRGTQLVTHYCIQLEKALGSPPEKKQRANSGSQLSQSNSNRKPTEAEAPADSPQRDVDDDDGTESTDPKIPLSAIG